jgi:hypothetical protein
MWDCIYSNLWIFSFGCKKGFGSAGHTSLLILDVAQLENQGIPSSTSACSCLLVGFVFLKFPTVDA